MSSSLGAARCVQNNITVKLCKWNNLHHHRESFNRHNRGHYYNSSPWLLHSRCDYSNAAIDERARSCWSCIVIFDFVHFEWLTDQFPIFDCSVHLDQSWLSTRKRHLQTMVTFVSIPRSFFNCLLPKDYDESINNRRTKRFLGYWRVVLFTHKWWANKKK